MDIYRVVSYWKDLLWWLKLCLFVYVTVMLTEYLYDVEYVTCTGGTSITVGLLGSIDF